MDRLDYQTLLKSLINEKVSRPTGGTLSGHAAGEPFDKLVYSKLKHMYGDYAFRQFEYLNDLFIKNPDVCGEDRFNLFQSKTLCNLLKRGKKQTINWSPSALFEEKQNDTADNIVLFKNQSKYYFELIDVKTRNISKDSQPPNIISALKLAEMCKSMIENDEFDDFSLNYLEINWLESEDGLECVGNCYKDLFKTNPSDLYINWAAALQIQFHVSDLSQDFKGNQEKWCRLYLDHFVKSAKHRINEMSRKMVKPYELYEISSGSTSFDKKM